MLLSLDPGIRGCGVALWNPADGQLVRAGYAFNRVDFGCDGIAWQGAAQAVVRWLGERARAVTLVVAEVPRIYPAAQQKGDQNDLIPLSAIDGYVCGLLNAHPITVYPRAWKGTVDPDAMIERIQKRLSPAETKLVELPSPHLAHNAWDAVGIGLWHFKRLQPVRVIAR